ncbi:MAG: DUF5803 family protein [Methanoregulaceae archaeon]|nr:DUF5803 family protein [Methanoregulaceae archaeon]
MRAANRDRRGPALVALCLALVVLAGPVQAVTAEYRVGSNGTVYNARIEVVEAEKYAFQETGPLGERVPLEVTNVSLEGECSPCTFSWTGKSGILGVTNDTITFAKGNYTVLFEGQVQDNHLLFTYEQPYRVEILLPEGLRTSNFLLGFVSPGGNVNATGNETLISWNNTRSAEVRFYDSGREELLYLFGNFWIIIAVLLLLPFMLTRRRRGKG